MLLRDVWTEGIDWSLPGNGGKYEVIFIFFKIMNQIANILDSFVTGSDCASYLSPSRKVIVSVIIIAYQVYCEI